MNFDQQQKTLSKLGGTRGAISTTFFPFVSINFVLAAVFSEESDYTAVSDPFSVGGGGGGAGGGQQQAFLRDQQLQPPHHPGAAEYEYYDQNYFDSYQQYYYDTGQQQPGSSAHHPQPQNFHLQSQVVSQQQQPSQGASQAKASHSVLL